MSDSDHEQPDPFELRLQFNDLLRRLTASQDSIARTAKFATQWRKHCDVLYTVLSEAIQQSANANQKMNLFYLCDHICMATLKIGFKGYINQFMNDMKSLVQMVCPQDNLGAANIPNVRKILQSWRKKGVLTEETCGELEAVFNEDQSERSVARDVTREEITSRIEEDRERQKRIKEEAWIRAPGEPLDIQFQEAWDTLQPLTKDDLDFALKQAEIWQKICCFKSNELPKNGWPK